MCEPEPQLSGPRRESGARAAQVRACALLWETASAGPRPPRSAVPALRIQCSRFFLPRLWLPFVLPLQQPARQLCLHTAQIDFLLFSVRGGNHRPLTKVRLRTSRRTRSSGEARSGSRWRRRRRRPGKRTEAAFERAAEPMPRDGGRARRDKSGARGMSPGPP